MVIIMVGMLFGLWWYQEHLRKRYAPQVAEDTPSEQEQQPEEQQPEEEKTDEYEIIED